MDKIKKIFMLGIVVCLGMMANSCGMCRAYNGYPGSYGYPSGRIYRDTGTRVTNNTYSWQDLQVVCWGGVVTIYRGVTPVASYDLRARFRSEVSVTYNAINFYGEPVKVVIRLNGYGRTNTVYCVCGNSEQHWFLT